MKRSVAMITTPWKYLARMVLAFGLLSMSGLAAAASQEFRVTCDIQHGPCVMKTDDGTSIELDILPRPVTAMSELTFIVTLSKNGKAVTGASVLLDLTMPGMSMGKNQVALKQARNGSYEGHGIIIRCMSGRKIWRAKATASHAGKTVAADFIFEVK